MDDWEQGTTEGGSSGSPLFDQNHHIVGQLHGGAASCTVIDYDEYGKFDVSWNGGGTPSTSLQPWLDPSNTTVTLDGNGFSCGASSLAAIVTDTSATLTWNATIDTITNFIIEFREKGTTTWTTYNISDTILSHDVFNLMPCTDYQFRIDMYCDSVWSGFTNIFEFTTDGCCDPPSNLIATNTSDSTATLSGDPVLIALSYDMRYREVGASSWTTVTGLTNVSYNLTNLTFCTDYEVEWRTICPSDTTTWEGITFTSSCGSCLDLPYCASEGNNVSDEWIEEVIVNTISNNSGVATVGYSDFTNISTTLQLGVTYPISVSQGYSGTVYTEHFSIWIDFNQDGTFDASEQVYASGATTTAPNTGTITIPITATLGNTRMRVSMQYDAPPPTCGSFTWGEVEDYCVDIIPAGAFCATPANLSTTNETTSSADLSWSAISSVIGYNVRYREVGTSTWTTTTSATNSMTLTGLADCADFEFEVEADCDTIGTSGYSSASTFTTICICDEITDLDTVVINSNDVTIDWTPTNNNQSYSVEYRIFNSPNWSNIPTTGNTYQMTGLVPGTLYEVRLRATCTDGIQSPYSNTLLFRTDWIVSANSLPTDITSLSVFPNPTSANLNLLVDLTNQQDISIEVFNVAGQVLKNQMTTLNSGENTVSIDLEHFISGVYFIRLTTENGVATRRVIKN